MSTASFLVLGIVSTVLAVGCAAEPLEEDSSSESDAITARQQCQSRDGRSVQGVSCHREAALASACRQARPSEVFARVSTSKLTQDGKWKTAQCRFEGETVTIRCCDDS